MFGIQDPGVWLAYLLCIFSVIFCIIYGIVNWNKGEEPIRAEDKKWVDDEKDVEDKL